jgi:hypothetical protein
MLAKRRHMDEVGLRSKAVKKLDSVSEFAAC